MPIDLAVVPVAGRGTRLLPLTKSQPKEMLPVGRRPVVQHVVEEMVRSGVRRIMFVTGAAKSAIENHFDIDAELIAHLRETGKEDLLAELAFERETVDYFFTRQRRQLGLGHAVLCAAPMVGDDPFVVALGDTIIGLNNSSDVTRRMIEEFDRRGADAVIAFQEVAAEDVVHYGIAESESTPGDVFRLKRIVEKPSVKDAPSRLAVAARYVFGPRIFEMLRKTQAGKGGEIQLTDAIEQLIAAGRGVYGVRLAPGESRYDIGNYESYFRTFMEFALADPQYGGEVRAALKKMLD
ncbi:MAG: UTP--glucose-1-phosphate uridylyltransferase [Pirellulales bacterium]